MMDMYMEKRLIGLHEAGSKSGVKGKLLAVTVSLALLFFIPFVHFGVIYYVWSVGKAPVNAASCTCDCFDTIFRGPYEWPPGSYKHVYFNSTAISLKIWFVLLLGIIVFYETSKYIVSLVMSHKLRGSMFLLLLSSFYPHYYGWWNFFSYLNEGFYSQWWHQIFFSLTEMLSTAVVLHLCNQENKIEPWKLLVILAINTMHIIVGSLDQFIDNIIFHKAKTFEASRDFGLLIPDFFHWLLCFFELRRLAGLHRKNVLRLFYKEEIMMSVLLVILFSLLGKSL